MKPVEVLRLTCASAAALASAANERSLNKLVKSCRSVHVSKQIRATPVSTRLQLVSKHDQVVERMRDWRCGVSVSVALQRLACGSSVVATVTRVRIAIDVNPDRAVCVTWIIQRREEAQVWIDAQQRIVGGVCKATF